MHNIYYSAWYCTVPVTSHIPPDSAGFCEFPKDVLLGRDLVTDTTLGLMRERRAVPETVLVVADGVTSLEFSC